MNTFQRRLFLRGVGATIALPFLEAHITRTRAASATRTVATTQSGAPLRMAFMSIPNGVQQDHWFPGDNFELNSTMRPLSSLKDSFQVIGGLSHDNATPGTDGAGDHARASATFLTGARARKTAGKDIYVGTSIDQVAARKLTGATRFPSLELSCESVRNTGSCDSGYACAYQYNLAWSTPTTPVSPEANPRLVFERLFGEGSRSERQSNLLQRRKTQKSILDFVLEDAGDLSRSLGARDSRKLDEYLSGVRNLEQRIESAEKMGEFPNPDEPTPAGIPDSFGEHMDLMYDLLVTAFETDSTRVATLLLAYDGSNRVFPEIGVREGHHHLTHNQRDPELAKKVAAIDEFYVSRFARFLKRLADTPDVDGKSLLHNSMLVYGGAIADGNRHSHNNLPVILAGNGGGAFETGRFVDAPEQPMSNLFVAMLDHMNIKVDSFGDSTERLKAI
ncbi:MAG TPA: hypothetical protein DDW52_14560 [Planctomycetaceae bacterium]|nr:hypothetical protein [Planctomycetaceae bacterium]